MFNLPLMTGHSFWKVTILGGLYRGVPMYVVFVMFFKSRFFLIHFIYLSYTSGTKVFNLTENGLCSKSNIITPWYGLAFMVCERAFHLMQNSYLPAATCRNNNVIITSNDDTTSFWRNNDVSLRRVSAGLRRMAWSQSWRHLEETIGNHFQSTLNTIMDQRIPVLS